MKEHGYTVTQLLYIGLACAKTFLNEASKGHSIVIVDTEGKYVANIANPIDITRYDVEPSG